MLQVEKGAKAAFFSWLGSLQKACCAPGIDGGISIRGAAGWLSQVEQLSPLPSTLKYLLWLCNAVVLIYGILLPQQRETLVRFLFRGRFSYFERD